MPRHNNAIPGVHFHKDWARRVRTFFSDPAKRKQRHTARLVKAKKLFPRPVSRLHPLVRCSSRRYNGRLRIGRGFTTQEVHAANWTVTQARSFGVSVDYRRRNRSYNSLNLNVNRLKAYKSKLIVLPRNWDKLVTEAKVDPVAFSKKYYTEVPSKYVDTKKQQQTEPKTRNLSLARKTDLTKIGTVTQNTQRVLQPLQHTRPVVQFATITDAQRKFSAYSTLVSLRKNNRPCSRRQKLLRKKLSKKVSKK